MKGRGGRGGSSGAATSLFLPARQRPPFSYETRGSGSSIPARAATAWRSLRLQRRKLLLGSIPPTLYNSDAPLHSVLHLLTTCSRLSLQRRQLLLGQSHLLLQLALLLLLGLLELQSR